MSHFLTGKQFGHFKVKDGKVSTFKKPRDASHAIAMAKKNRGKPTKAQLKGFNRPK